jgi:hypothetical protein
MQLRIAQWLRAYVLALLALNGVTTRFVVRKGQRLWY